jgi:hypothetical protein
MWVLTEDDNDAALATYTRAGASRESTTNAVLSWVFAARQTNAMNASSPRGYARPSSASTLSAWFITRTR